MSDSPRSFIGRAPESPTVRWLPRSSGPTPGLNFSVMVHDTHPAAARVRWKALARRLPTERLSEALALSDAVRSLERLGAAHRSSKSNADGGEPKELKDR